MIETTNHSIDASGLICPEPIMMLHGAVRDAKAGELIELISTDPAAIRDVRQFCEFLGHQLVAQEEEGEKTHHLIKKVVNPET